MGPFGRLCAPSLSQAISGENFSQSEYVAFGAISQFAFPPLAKAIHREFHYVNLSNLCSKQAFRSINLSNVGFIIESQSVRIHISFRQKPLNKLRFEAENSTDPYAFARIDWDRLVVSDQNFKTVEHFDCPCALSLTSDQNLKMADDEEHRNGLIWVAVDWFG